MINHVVLLRLTNDASDTDISNLIKMFQDLPNRILAIRTLTCGRDVGLSKRNSDFAILAEFETVDSFREYETHPAHLKIVDYLSESLLIDFRTCQFEIPDP